ncbi:hypothetical protein B0H13DRAFT_2682439 [Mycena leptocephala]|nr:hypothetical protein B0H13DRAFT_2682439 [Mycena leptocephala]
MPSQVLSQTVFLYRCYAIWGESRYKRHPISLPLFLLLLATVFGIATTVLDSFPDSSIGDIFLIPLALFITNLLLTCLTVGRILWTRRQLQVTGETKLIKRSNTAIAMLLESNIIYFVFILPFWLLQLKGAAAFRSPLIALFIGASGQLMNILPALAILWGNLVRTVDADSIPGNLKLQSSI